MSKKVTTEEFIRRARATHGDKYDYSRVVYKSRLAKVIIGCPVHGWFRQAPPNHYLHGCRECGKKKTQRLTTADFVERARAVHGDKYDYSRVRYAKTTEEVEVVCPTHGPFWIRPKNHLYNRRGCPVCIDEMNRAKTEQRTEE